jgi:hypothetical protein
MRGGRGDTRTNGIFGKEVVMSRRKYRLASLAISVMAVFLLTGGYYINSSFYVGLLMIGDRYISKCDGQACLIAGDNMGKWKVCLTAGDNMGKWKLSNPTLASVKGEYYLAYSLDEEDMNVYFTKKRGEATEWTFINIRPFGPRSYRNKLKGDRVLKEGGEGYEFQLMVKNGPYAGWYLAEGPVGNRPLILVKERRQAATLRYVQTQHHPRSLDKK